MSLELLGIILYVAFQLGVGIYFSRNSRQSETGYFLAGRNVGFALATGSIAATWFGAETCIGSSALVYGSGLSGGRADPFGYTICLLLMAIVLAGRLWRGGFITLGDMFRQRYGPTVETFAVLLMIPTSLLWAGAQIRAFGQVVAVSSEMGFHLGALIATIVVIVYSAMGGLKADILTDLVQGIGITIGLALLAIVAVVHLGGVDAAWNTIDPDRLRFLANGESVLTQLDGWMVPILGSLVAQELIARVSASRTAVVARGATFAAAGLYLVIGLLPIGLALLGPKLLPGLEDHEQFLPALAHAHLNSFLYVVFAGAIVSAILSTVDSALIAVGSLTSHNLLRFKIGDASDRTKVVVARLCVVAAGIVAFVIAIMSDSVHELVESASGFGSSGLLIITLFGLFTRFGGRVAGTCSLAAGVIAILAAQHIWELQAPFVFSIAASLIAYLIAAFIERKIHARTLSS